jgi:hypothetical protein
VSLPSINNYINSSQFVLPSIRALTLNLIIVIFKNIKVIKKELLFIRLKHLYHRNIIKTTYYSSTSRALEIKALSRHYKITTRSNILYIKLYINKGAYGSLAK